MRRRHALNGIPTRFFSHLRLFYFFCCCCNLVQTSVAARLARWGSSFPRFSATKRCGCWCSDSIQQEKQVSWATSKNCILLFVCLLMAWLAGWLPRWPPSCTLLKVPHQVVFYLFIVVLIVATPFLCFQQFCTSSSWANPWQLFQLVSNLTTTSTSLSGILCCVGVISSFHRIFFPSHSYKPSSSCINLSSVVGYLCGVASLLFYYRLTTTTTARLESVSYRLPKTESNKTKGQKSDKKSKKRFALNFCHISVRLAPVCQYSSSNNNNNLSIRIWKWWNLSLTLSWAVINIA